MARAYVDVANDFPEGREIVESYFEILSENPMPGDFTRLEIEGDRITEGKAGRVITFSVEQIVPGVIQIISID